MGAETLGRLCYWGGWASAVVAVVYKFLAIYVLAGQWVEQTRILPHYIWQLSFLLFLISIASASRAKSA